MLIRLRLMPRMPWRMGMARAFGFQLGRTGGQPTVIGVSLHPGAFGRSLCHRSREAACRPGESGRGVWLAVSAALPLELAPARAAPRLAVGHLSRRLFTGPAGRGVARGEVEVSARLRAPLRSRRAQGRVDRPRPRPSRASNHGGAGACVRAQWAALSPGTADYNTLGCALQFRVVKTNKRGKAQNRVLELNFTDGIIQVPPFPGEIVSLSHGTQTWVAALGGGCNTDL